MVSIYSVDPNQLIEAVAEELKKINVIEAPEWASIAKTGVHKERPPQRDDWWYVRAAAILRTIYKMGPIGVSKLRTKYGGIKNRGVRPEKFFRGSGNIIRKVMQQLEKAELVKQGEAGNHKGRIIAPKGKSIIDKAAVALLKTMPKEKITAEEPKEEKPKAKPKTEKKAEVKKSESKEEKKAEVKEKPAEKKPEVKEEKKVEEKPAEASETKVSDSVQDSKSSDKKK